ncbi:MAG: GNAT family N-acetyltransferase [Promethearchaeota archaeon]|nr:MAG: GNAT family N-acetyltransferase [Candidatus Lokiarchaeota archaeon]
MNGLTVRSITKKDYEWIKKTLINYWSSIRVVAQNREYFADSLPGFLAIYRDNKVGLLIYTIERNKLLIISIISIIENIGIGSLLLKRATQFALKENLNSLIVTTTNDNTDALRFYQIKGFTIKKVNINIMKKYRRLKPQIPIKGKNDIEIKDEIILEKKIII